MKNLKTTIAILAITSIAIFTSCKKTSSTNSAASSGGSVTATIGSVSFNAASVNISKVSNVVTVQGAQADGGNINIQVIGLVNAPTTATYSLDPNAGNTTNFACTASYQAPVSGTTAGRIYASGGCDANLPRQGFVPSGSITFTEVSATKIAGTFLFKGAYLSDCGDVKMISTGSFSKTF